MRYVASEYDINLKDEYSYWPAEKAFDEDLPEIRAKIAIIITSSSNEKTEPTVITTNLVFGK